MKFFHKLTILIAVISLVFTYVPSVRAEEALLNAEDAVNKLNYEIFTNEIYYAITQDVDLSASEILNVASEAINELTVADAPKLQPLPTNASDAAIEARQAEIKAFAQAYNAFVTQNVEAEATATPDTLEQVAMDAETGSRTSVTPLEKVEAMYINGEAISTEDARIATAYGENGAKLLADTVNNTPDKSFSEIKSDMHIPYMAGFSNQEISLDTDIKREAYFAGREDRAMADLEADVKAKNAVVFGDESGVDFNDEHAKPYNRNELKMADTMGKDLGSQVGFEERILDEYAEANASYQGGKITFSNNSDNKLFVDAVHEGFHRMKEMNTPEVQTLERELFAFADSEGILFENERAKHEMAGITLDTGGNIEEVVAGIIPKLWKNEKDWLKWRERLDANPELRAGWQKLMDIISEIIEKFRRLLKEGSFSKEARAKVNKDLAELERFRNLYGDAYKATMDAVAEKTKDVQTEKAETNPTKNIEIITNEDYNGDIRHSLKDEYWHTDLSKKQIKEVENWLRKKGSPEATRITDTANWYKGRIDGEDLFVIYSTEDVNNPTILYEIKGGKARVELDILMDILEDEENGKSINGKSSFTQRVSQGSWLQNVNNSQDNLRNLGSGPNNQNVGVLQGQSQRNGSPAFRAVVENLFKRQEQNGSVNEGKRYSLKEIVDENNKSYGIGVVLDSTLLDNLTPEERVEMVKEYVKELGGNTFTAYDSNGVAVDIKIAESKKHFKNKSGKNVAVNKDLTSYLGKNETKQEAITLVDELIVSAKYSHSEVAKHSHGWLDNKGKNNWDYWTTYIQDKNKTIWEARLNIANSTNGEKILYDIFPIKKVGQSVTSDKSTTDGSLSQNQKSVKKNFSLKGGVSTSEAIWGRTFFGIFFGTINKTTV